MENKNTLFSIYYDWWKNIDKFLFSLIVLLFLTGLFIKLLFVFFSYPVIHDLFLPFLKSSIYKFSLDPWTSFLSINGDINSFPYGIVMLLVYLPFSTIGNFIDSNLIDLNFFEIGFKFSSLIIDYFLFSILYIITKFKSKRLLGNFPQAYSHLALIDCALNFNSE